MQKAFALFGSGCLLLVWVFLLVTSPFAAVILMLAAVAWREHRRRRVVMTNPASRVRFLHSTR
jgi:multisubunit Na+/H+ antiporter MnhG subunit